MQRQNPLARSTAEIPKSLKRKRDDSDEEGTMDDDSTSIGDDADLTESERKIIGICGECCAEQLNELSTEITTQLDAMELRLAQHLEKLVAQTFSQTIQPPPQNKKPLFNGPQKRLL